MLPCISFRFVLLLWIAGLWIAVVCFFLLAPSKQATKQTSSTASLTTTEIDRQLSLSCLTSKPRGPKIVLSNNAYDRFGK